MSQETQTETEVEAGTSIADWQAGVGGGLVGGAVMGAMITMMMPMVIAVAIPALYGLAPPPNGLLGWIVHMSHSAILGVVFAAIMATALQRYATSVGASAVAGLIYGIVLWAVLAALVMPLWLQALGFPQAPPFPNFALPGSLPAHVVYGVLLGAIYPLLRG
jgi:hypothetical protein